MKVCVYCASSNAVPETYKQDAFRLGEMLAEQGINVVFGAGKNGLMGQLAEGVLSKHGKIRGVIPHFMIEREWQHPNLTEIEIVETMHERKERFLIGCTGIIALPGGVGTLEELLEVITLKQLGKFPYPIIIYNQNGYYDSLKGMFTQALNEDFIHNEYANIWTFVDKLEDIIPTIKNTEPWYSSKDKGS